MGNVEKTISRTRKRIQEYVAENSENQKDQDYREFLAKCARLYELDKELNSRENDPEPEVDDLETRTMKLKKLIGIEKEVIELIR